MARDLAQALTGPGLGRVCLLVVVVWFFLLPLWRLVRLSLTTDTGVGTDHYAEVFAQPATWSAFTTTAQVSLAATALAVVFGTALAWLVAHTDVPGKGVIQVLILLPFLLPSYVVALAWVRAFGQNGPLGGLGVDLYTRGGIVFVLALTTVPIVFLMAVWVLRGIPVEIEQAARASGAGPLTAFCRITLPAALPGIAGGGLLAFLSALDNFGVPAFLGTPSGIQVLSTLIHQQVIGFGPSAFSRAAALSVLLGALALAGTLAHWLLLRRTGTQAETRTDAPPRVHLGRARLPVALTVGGVLAALSAVPLVAMVRSSLAPAVGVVPTWDTATLRHYVFLLSTSDETRTAVGVSLRLAALTVLVCLVVGSFVAYARVRRPSGLSRLAEAAVALPFALPGVVLALAVIFAWVQPLPGVYPGIYGTWLILLVAYVTRFAFFQVRSVAAGLSALDPSVAEAARASGAGPVTVWRRIMLPLLAGSLISGAFLVAVNAMSELTVSAILYSAGSQTVGVVIMGFERAGSPQLSAALSTLLLLAYCVLGLLVLALTRLLRTSRLRTSRLRTRNRRAH